MLRFIPTPVGNTRSSASTSGWPAVHPHARGEHPPLTAKDKAWAGSSPRPWGTRAQPLPRAARRAVHPHARGEHAEIQLPHPCRAGSSPRPWGTPTTAQWSTRRARFIPTPVGNTRLRRSRTSARPVHPHARGEHSRLNTSRRWICGSSPRPWGTRAGVPWRASPYRFIPTPVGNTVADCTERTADAVHPHARGEHSSGLNCNWFSIGSSPRPWGTLSVQWRRIQPHRFIPTPVGNTSNDVPVRAAMSVHPHARGEHTSSTLLIYKEKLADSKSTDLGHEICPDCHGASGAASG